MKPPGLEVLRAEIATYFRELPRLLAEGHEGRFVLIKGDQIVGIWDTSGDALQAGYDRFGVGEPFLDQPIDSRDLTRPYPPDLVPRPAI